MSTHNCGAHCDYAAMHMITAVTQAGGTVIGVCVSQLERDLSYPHSPRHYKREVYAVVEPEIIDDIDARFVHLMRGRKP